MGVCFSILTSITPCKSQCQEMTLNFSPIGQDLEAVNTAKYPGVDLSNDLSRNSHIDRTAKKANSMLGFLQRNLRINTITSRLLPARHLFGPNYSILYQYGALIQSQENGKSRCCRDGQQDMPPTATTIQVV